MSSLAQAVASALAANKRFLPAFGISMVLVSILIWRAGYNYHIAALGEIASRAERYSAVRSVVDRAGEFNSRKESYEAKLRILESGLLGEDKPSIGSARLQEKFKALASKHNVNVLSQKVLPPVPAGRYVRLPVEFQVRAELPRIKELLYDIQASHELIGVRYLRVKAPESSPGSLDVTVMVEGAIRK